MPNETVYERDAKGNWWRDGKRVNSVPEKVTSMTKNMALVCKVRVPKAGSKKNATARLIQATLNVARRDIAFRCALERELRTLTLV